MAVSEKDRKDYEAGVKDSKKGVIAQAARDIVGDHPGSPAYYKGRAGRTLDDDKRSDGNKK